MNIKRLAVFCGSQSGKKEIFATHTIGVGKVMVQQNIELVYGGGNVGLMGLVANTVLEGGGKVMGVIPAILDKRERSHKGLTQLLVTEDMHQRKKLMFENCDAAIILVGGFGTMDELFEMITWNNLAIHDKKIFILNTDGFYSALLDQMKVMYDEGFLYQNPFESVVVLAEPEELIHYL